MQADDIKNLLSFGERIQLEVKEAKNSVPKSIWETYSSFANTQGGYILLGISENLHEEDILKRFTVVGVDDPRKVLTDFWNTINSEKVSANLLRDEDVEMVDVDGKDVVSIHIPQADYRNKPVYINGNAFKGSFRRNHEGDYHCTEQAVREMIRDASESGNDGMLIENYGMDDIDIDTLHSYRQIFEIRNHDHVFNGYNDKEFLRNLGGFTTERATGKEGLTVAGLLMFGKGLPVRDRFDNFRMDYLDQSNLLPGMRWSDRLTYDGNWPNNLFNFFRLVLPKLSVGTKHPFKLDGIQRIDETQVDVAIREAFTNT